MAKVTIIGAGAMGSALTVPLIDNGHQVRLWGTELDTEIIEAVRKGQPHPKHKHCIPSQVLTYTVSELEQAATEADLIIMAITSEALGKIFKRVLPYIKPGMIVGTVSKGFEYGVDGDIIILPDLLESLLPLNLRPEVRFVAVGGPCKATELLWRTPTGVTYASKDIQAAQYMRKLLLTNEYRIEVTTDVIGTEACAALKNAYAVGLGMAEGFRQKQGLPFNNTKSALFTYAIREMKSLSLALGGTIHPVYGFPGIGDLEVTGEAGRNRMLGEVIGGGLTASQAIAKMQAEQITVEGYPAIRFGYNLAKQLARDGKLALKEIPLLEGLYNVLYQDAEAFTTMGSVIRKYTS
ncbi:glycerol-3-phosphate dehydrogenase nad-dependent [Lucifera butyrica]|uniref:Glycerol-3-phosphate dehydrogenase n=1 Tax=Lucifera butyrica TaxID=1351585 RepID=A0A498RBC5_9FIRM|nr:NAD(P)-binding domain-containing protein [Lucifera butyrica]VBB07572.1 glycerol-3-phosphate dehydrogenase nad-dependent [Lucifera butyrica]